jgi:hypothetical protein
LRLHLRLGLLGFLAGNLDEHRCGVNLHSSPFAQSGENACQNLWVSLCGVTQGMQEFSFPWWFLLIEYAGGTSLAAYLPFTTCDGFRRPKSSPLILLSMTRISTAVNDKDAL